MAPSVTKVTRKTRNKQSANTQKLTYQIINILEHNNNSTTKFFYAAIIIKNDKYSTQHQTYTPIV